MIFGWISSWLRLRISLGGPLVGEAKMMEGTCDMKGYDVICGLSDRGH